MERGPGRHGISNAFFLYIRDPDGHRIELFTSDYLTVDPDLEPLRWSLTDPQRQTLWGHPAPKSWFEEGSEFLGAGARAGAGSAADRGAVIAKRIPQKEITMTFLKRRISAAVWELLLLLVAAIIFATVYRIYFSRAVALTQVCERIAELQNGENADMFNRLTATQRLAQRHQPAVPDAPADAAIARRHENHLHRLQSATRRGVEARLSAGRSGGDDQHRAVREERAAARHRRL